MIVYSYEVALYFGAALEYRGALVYSSFVAALSSSVELVAALSLARSGRRARTSTAALYLMAGAASGLALAAVVIYSHLPAGFLSDVVEPGAALCLVRECNLTPKASPLRGQSSPTHPARLADVFGASARLLREHAVPLLPLFVGRSHRSAGPSRRRRDDCAVRSAGAPVGRCRQAPLQHSHAYTSTAARCRR